MVNVLRRWHPHLADQTNDAAAAALGLLTQSAPTDFGAVWFWFVLFGAGVGLIAAPSTAAAMVSVDVARTGMASGAVNAARQIGSVLGSSTLGAVLTSTLIGHPPSELTARGVAARSVKMSSAQ